MTPVFSYYGMHSILQITFFTWCSAKNNFTWLYTIIHSFTYMAKGKKFLKYDPKLYMETLQPFTGEALVAMPKTLPKSRLNLVPKSLVNIMVYFIRCRYRLDFFLSQLYKWNGIKNGPDVDTRYLYLAQWIKHHGALLCDALLLC